VTELLTNGLIPAVRHRVREVESDRESVAFFQNVAPMPVGPLEHFVRDGAPVRYPTVSSAIPYAGGDSGVPRWKTHARPVTASSPGE
jgi:isopenicillin N synthase-like dioxygenase